MAHKKNNPNVVINPKPSVALNFNEKNPLNYVRPITVNLYFKHSNPGVGTYKTDTPFAEKKKNYCKAQFISKTKREHKWSNTEGVPPPNQYDIQEGFQKAYQDKDKVSSSFMPSTQKKIIPVNLYDPHSEVDKKQTPGPGQYEIIKNKIKQQNTKLDMPLPSAAFIEENTDRFGKPIFARAPLNQKPGPGQYYPEFSTAKSPRGGYLN